jgi:hypothetical protein
MQQQTRFLSAIASMNRCSAMAAPSPTSADMLDTKDRDPVLAAGAVCPMRVNEPTRTDNVALRALATVMGRPVEELTVLLRRRRYANSGEQVSALAGTLISEEDEAERRAFLTLLAAAGSGLIDVERLAPAVVDGAYLRDAEALTANLLGQWYGTNPAVLLPPVLGHLRALQQALPGSPELENLTGRTSLLAGHLLTMLGRPGEARTCYALTESLARDAKDNDLEVAALICCSALHDWRRGNDPRRSAELVHGAATMVKPGTDPHLRVWVMARRAEERAVLGDVVGFERDMVTAEAAVRGGGDMWYGPRDAAELAAVRGAGELVLGRYREAAQTLAWTLERMSPEAVNWRRVVAEDRDRALAAL